MPATVTISGADAADARLRHRNDRRVLSQQGAGGGSGVNALTRDLEHILEHTRDLWRHVQGQNVFVTGGTGFFGRWLLESFLYANERLALDAGITVLSRDPDAFARKAPHLSANHALSFVRGDVRNFRHAVAPEKQFGFVIHAATEANALLNEQDPLTMIDTIVEGTRQTLQFARDHGGRRFLLTSSGAVYGTQPPDLRYLTEEYLGGPDVVQPRSAYGEAKRLAELLCVCYAKQCGLQPIIARCFAFVGPFLPLDAHFAIGNFIRDALQGGPIVVNGDGSPYRSYLYAADLAIWLWTLLFAGVSGRPYNVGSAEAIQIGDLAQLVGSVVNSDISVEVAQKRDPAKPAERYVPSVERAASELGLRPLVSLPDAIGRTAAFSRQVGNAGYLATL
jgi:nucleoside-diphosphate-sugar epimerase